MRIVLYIMILGALLFAPVERADVGKLQPVEVVLLHEDAGEVILKTDTGDSGKGQSVQQALDNMRQNASRIVYLDTATNLLVTKNAVGQMHRITEYVNSDVRVCIAHEDTDLTQAASYLQTHTDQPTVAQWRKGKSLPILGAKK